MLVDGAVHGGGINGMAALGEGRHEGPEASFVVYVHPDQEKREHLAEARQAAKDATCFGQGSYVSGVVCQEPLASRRIIGMRAALRCVGSGLSVHMT